MPDQRINHGVVYENMREVARQNESKICPVKLTEIYDGIKEIPRKTSPQIANNFVIF